MFDEGVGSWSVPYILTVRDAPLSVSVTDLQVTWHFSAWRLSLSSQSPQSSLSLLPESLTTAELPTALANLDFYDDKLVILLLSNIENVNFCP